jgi:hypothetical protein
VRIVNVFPCALFYLQLIPYIFATTHVIFINITYSLYKRYVERKREREREREVVKCELEKNMQIEIQIESVTIAVLGSIDVNYRIIYKLRTNTHDSKFISPFKFNFFHNILLDIKNYKFF